MTDAPNESALAALGDEFVGRIRSGEQPRIDEFVERRPDLEAEIRELFPVLAVMEGLKPPRGSDDAVPTSDMPDRIGPYVILREIGRGGMGRVFEATGAEGERVALKIVHPHLVDRPGFLARFLREVETGSRVEHPGIVRTIASGIAEQDGTETPYLALEFIEGQNLRELLEEVSPLSERLCRVIGVSVAQALAAIHDAGIVHRDIKPENVVITDDESVKLMDLGVALFQEEQRRLTATGEFVGSLMYAAPEQIRGGHVGPPSDLYALGLVLYELLTGHHVAVRGGRAKATFVGVMHEPVSVADDAPHVSPFMDAIVRVLLEPDHRRRPESAGAVARVLGDGERSDWWKEQLRDRAARDRPRSDLPKMIGREEELRRLDALLLDLERNQGRACAVLGDAGIGKSLLVNSWLSSLQDRPDTPRLLEIKHLAAASPHTTCPMAGALSAVIDDSSLRSTVLSVLAGDADLTDAVVSHIRGVDGDARGVSVPVLEKSYVGLLTHLAASGGLIVFVEDVHRATEDRQQSFLRLIRATARFPILFVATGRPPLPPDFVSAFGQIKNADDLLLGPLDAQASFAVVQSAAGEAVAGASGVRELIRRADGNPYYLIELSRALARRSASTRGDSDPHAPIPETLEALIASRLAVLSSDQHDLLAAAACSGDTFDPEVVAAGAEMPKIAGLRMLGALDRDHQLIEPIGTRYRFRQRLVQEKLHDDLPPALRAAYHGALGSVLESRCVGVCPPHLASEIASHHLLGDDAGRALPYVRDALDYLVAQYETRRAARMAERVLALDDPLSDEVRAHTLMVYGSALKGFAPPKDAAPVLAEAREIAERVGDEHLALEALVGFLDCEREVGHIESALELASAAAPRADALDDARLSSMMHAIHARLLRDLGRLEEARVAAQHGLDRAQASGDLVAVGVLSWTLGGMELELSDLKTARVLFERATSIAHLHGDLDLESSALNALAKVEHLEGKLGATIEILERVIGIARERGDTRIETVTSANLAHAIPFTGDYRAAEAYAARAEEVSGAMGYYEIQAHALLSLGHIRAEQGALGGAIEVLQDARALIGKMPTPSMEARLSVLIPNVLSWTGQFDEATAIIERGLEVAREAGSPREILLIEWAKGVQLVAKGRRAEALAVLAEIRPQIDATGASQITAMNQQRLGELHLLEGEFEPARACLESARTIAEPGGLVGIAALSRLWLELLPDGSPIAARVEIDRHRERMPAHARLRAYHALAEVTGDEALLTSARAEAQALVDSMPADKQKAMIRAVPLYFELLG